MSNSNSSNVSPTMDLDALLAQQEASQPSSASPADLPMPEADRMVIVGTVVDDSGSMESCGPAIREGLKNVVAALRGSKGTDFYIILQGFKQIYYEGMISGVTDEDIDQYSPDHESTPLYETSVALLRKVHNISMRYSDLGIPNSCSALLFTDGLPDDEDRKDHSAEFIAEIDQTDFIVGIGVVNQKVGNAEKQVSNYSSEFKSMGIPPTRILTPNNSQTEIRRAMNQFSQSVATL